MAHIVTIPAPLSAGELGNSEPEAVVSTGFAAFDEQLLRGAPGCFLLQVPDVDVARAAFAHACRRLLRANVAPVSVTQAPAAPLFVEIARRLNIGLDDLDPKAFADRLAAALRAERLALFGPLPAPGTWDHAVAAELADREIWSFLWTGLGVASSGVGSDAFGTVLSLGVRLDEEERHRWTAAVAEASHVLLDTHDVLELERRLQALRVPGAPLPVASVEASTLHNRLVLAARGWPESQLSLLSAAGPLDELVTRGDVLIERGLISPVTVPAAAASAEDFELVASALMRCFPSEPWALARAAIMLLRAGRAVDADAYMERASKQLCGEARRELAKPWLEALESVEDAEQQTLFASAAVRALDAGDCEEALRLARRAMRGSAPSASLSLLVAKAACAVGDLMQARVALEHAHEAVQTNGDAIQRDQVESELAEIAYLTGDHAHASSLTAALIARTDRPEARLAARGVDGKILLAQGKYEDAERLFAEDAWTAERAALGTPSRRARLNRAIALMMLGRLGEARVLFQTVHEEGTRERDDQACAYSLENLAHLAAFEHAYGTALSHADQALALRRRQGDRMRIVRLLSNVATFRRVVGLVEHAEHAIRFARRIGPGIPFDAAPRLGIEAARLALDLGNPMGALEEVNRVLREGERARDRGRVLAEAHRLRARVALEDGNVARVREALELAATLAGDDESEWEQSFLRAALARAEGSLDLTMLQSVLDKARTLADYEFSCESLLFAAEVQLGLDHVDAARAHLEECAGLRQRVLSSLSQDQREAFAIQRLSRVFDSLSARVQRSEPEPAEEMLAPATIRSSSPPSPLRAAREIVGEDPQVRTLRAAIKRVARSQATVLIRGESGTGKELVAEALHRASERANGPLVTVNCAALVETLLLSELFGHEKGAFTGAAARRRGRFELAEGGTLFLDEIGDISARTQVALLRVLQEKTFERVGGTAPIRANVRIVCATHRDLKAMVERGEFREDLYYRLRGITLEVPALRARAGDLPAIATHLLARIALERDEQPKTLSASAIELLQRHRWPGNVRELENALRAASLFADGPVIDVRDFLDNVDDLRGLAGPAGVGAAGPNSSSWLPPAPLSVVPMSRATLPSLPVDRSDESGELEIEPENDDEAGALPLPAGETGATAVAYNCIRQGSVSLGDLKRQIERDCVARALAETKGNITRAAALLGMKRPRLSQLVKQYGLAAVSEGS